MIIAILNPESVEPMYCSHCGSANPDVEGVRYCRWCGTLLPQPGLSGNGDGQALLRPDGYAGAATIILAPSAAPAASPSPLPAVAAKPYGGFWARLVAYLIDFAIVVPLMVILNAAVVFLFDPDWQTAANIVAALLNLAWSSVYYVVLPPAIGATPGKLLLGYEIVDRDGHRIGLGRSNLRLLAQGISSLTLCLGYVWIGIDGYKQGWHDKIAGTYVVRREFVRRDRRGST